MNTFLGVFLAEVELNIKCESPNEIILMLGSCVRLSAGWWPPTWWLGGLGEGGVGGPMLYVTSLPPHSLSPPLLLSGFSGTSGNFSLTH